MSVQIRVPGSGSWCVNATTTRPVTLRSVVGEYPGGLNETGTDAGSVLNAELAGSAPPQADGIVG